MTTESENDSVSDRLDQVLADYLRAEERGTPLDQQTLIAANPELAEELASFFRNRSAMQSLAELVQPHELSTVGSDPAASLKHTRNLGVFGDYELESELARGGMGIVYRAKQRSLQRTVALKMVLAGNHASAAELARFRQEAEAAAQLDHAHIVPVYEVGEQDGQSYYTMKLIEGGDLNGQLARLKEDPRSTARLLESVARAVHFAHQHGILHRDLKPANILVDQAGEPHVADFGLARLTDSNDRMTQTGAALGTPGYMAPEQIRGERLLTTAADVYSLGAILYVCLTGEPPFKGANAWEAMQRALDSDPPSPRSANPRIDRDLETICKKALERNPAKRYESAVALADDLSRWLKHEPIIARPPSPMRRTLKWVRRHPAWTTVICMSVVMLVVVGNATWRERMADSRAEGFLYRTLLALAEREWSAGAIFNARETLAKCPENRRGWEWEYVRRLCYITPSHRLGDFPQPFTDGGFSADGSRVFAIDTLGTVRIWNANTRSDVAQFSLQGNGKASLSPDGKQLAVATHNTLLVYRVDDPIELWRWESQSPIHGVEYSPTGKTLAVLIHPSEEDSSDSTGQIAMLLLLEARNGAVELREPLTKSSYRYDGWMKFVADGRLVVFDSAYNPTLNDSNIRSLRNFHADSHKRLDDVAIPESVDGTSGQSRDLVAISPDGQHVVFVFQYQHYVEVRRIADGTSVRIPINSGDVSSFSFSADSRRLAYFTSEMNLDLDDLKLHEAIPTLGPMLALAAKTQPFLLQGHVVDVQTGKELSTLRGFDGRFGTLRLAPRGETLVGVGGTSKQAHDPASVDTFGQVVLWNVEERATSREITANNEAAHDLAVSSDGKFLAVAQEDKTVRVWDAVSGALVREFTGFDQPVKSVSFLPGLHQLFAASASKVELRDCDTGNLEWTFANVPNEPAGNMASSALRPDGAQIAIPYGQVVKVIDAVSSRTEFEVEGNAQFLSYSPDGKYLAIPYQFDLHGELKIVDAQTGKVLHHFFSEKKLEYFRTGWGYLRASFSPDGRYVAAVGNIGGAHVYDLRSGKLVRKLTGHGTTVWDAAFTADGSRLATSGYSDGTVKLWALATGEEVHTLRGHEEHVTGVEFSFDDSRLFSADTGGVVRIWEAR